jgi:hypothetical protein
LKLLAEVIVSRILIFVLLVLSSLAATARDIPSELIYNSYLGSDVSSEGNPPFLLRCVDFKVEKKILPTAVRYELRVIPENGSMKATVSMIISDQRAVAYDILELPTRSGGLQYDRICGEEFVSEIELGAQIYFSVLFRDLDEASLISPITMSESGPLTASKFLTAANFELAKLKSVAGKGFGFTGESALLSVLTGLEPERAFEEYKKIAIADKEMRRVVGGKISRYPWK